MGYRSLREMEENLSASEFDEWVEYFSLYPEHKDVSEVQLATLSLLQERVKKGASYKDFLVSHIRKKETKKLQGKKLEEFILGAF